MSKTMNAVAILLCAQAAHADVLFFLDEVEFQVALEQAGKVLKGFEDFPWEAAPNDVIGTDDPFDWTTSVPGWIKPGTLLNNVTYQSNLDPSGFPAPNPRGLDGLALFTTRFFGATHNGLVSNHSLDSLDILSGVPEPANHTAMGLQLVSFDNPPGASSVRVSVYDKEDILIGTSVAISAPANQGGAFLGVLVTGGGTIGRINLYDFNANIAFEGLYAIAVYVPAPCPWDLDNNNDVGVGDLLVLLAAWGPNPGHPADFDGNDDVGVSDLLVLLANWGPCP